MWKLSPNFSVIFVCFTSSWKYPFHFCFFFGINRSKEAQKRSVKSANTFPVNQNKTIQKHWHLHLHSHFHSCLVFFSRKVREKESERSKTLGWVSLRHCCMSVEYYSDNYYGGYGALANPLQWPQLRKKRRLVASKTTPPPLPPQQHHLKSPPTIGPTHLRIRPARDLPWQPWSLLLSLSLTLLLLLLLLQPLLQPKVQNF